MGIRWLSAASQQPGSYRARLLVGILAWAAMVASAGAAVLPDLPHPTDLRKEAAEVARTTAPLVVLFSQRSCRWCDQARTYLVPMARPDATGARPLFRQIDLDSDAPLLDFEGRPTTQRGFARAEVVRFTPTLVIYGPNGERLGEPVVGMRLPDFYGLYVERAIDEARARMNKPLEWNEK